MLPVNLDCAVLLPEKVVVSYRLANVGSRIVAHLVDLLIAFALIIVTDLLIGLTLGRVDTGLTSFFTLLVTTFGLFLYFSLFEGLWNGQTLGKKALSLRVRSIDGTPVTFVGALYRNLLRPADFLPFFYLVGMVAIFTNPRAQRLGDLGAGTIVTFEPRAVPRFTPAPHKFGLHPFESTVGNLSGMTLEEYFAIKRLCDRFPELAPAVQQRNIKELWEPFAQRRNVPHIPNVHPVYLMEAVVMSYGRSRGLI